jgi:hypothetical protein
MATVALCTFAASVLPLPLSPHTIIDWFLPVINSVSYALSATLKMCGVVAAVECIIVEMIRKV